MFRERIDNLELSIRKISEKAAKQDEIIRFDIGQPSFDTPEHVKDVVREKLDQKQGYTPVKGIEQLREQIVEEENLKQGIDIEKKNVMATTGEWVLYMLYLQLCLAMMIQRFSTILAGAVQTYFRGKRQQLGTNPVF